MEYTTEQAEQIAREKATRFGRSIRYMGVTQSNSSAMKQEMECHMQEILTEQVLAMNSTCGTRKRKTMEQITGELSSRNLAWIAEKNTAEGITVTLGGTHYRIFYNRGICISYDVHSTYLRNRIEHCTANAKDLVDLLVFINDVYILYDAMVKKKLQRKKQSVMISSIEFPIIEQRAKEFLAPRGIRYELYNLGEKIGIDVQISGEVWMSNWINSTNMERVLRIIPCLLKCPNCIKEDGRGFKMKTRFN